MYACQNMYMNVFICIIICMNLHIECIHLSNYVHACENVLCMYVDKYICLCDAKYNVTSTASMKSVIRPHDINLYHLISLDVSIYTYSYELIK